jgi:hypothetical protein
MMSIRYAPAICAVMLLALVPTIIHSYAGVVVADSLSTRFIPETLGDYASTPTRRSADWGERRFDSFDWFERQYASPQDTVVLTVVRSYDLKALYHHPELAVAYHFANYSTASVGTIDGHPEMPVHVLANTQGGAVGLYVLHYDGRFITDPIRFQIRTAGELLFTGRKAMTLLFVRDDSVPLGASPLKLPAAALLLDAVRHFAEPGTAGR